MTNRRIAFFVVLLSTLLAGCPYESSVEPSGIAVPFRATLVGRWTCDTDDEHPWGDLLIGRTEEGLYSLRLIPAAPEGPAKGHTLAYARARRIGGREVWSLWEDAGAPVDKFSFVRVGTATRHMLRLGWLGNGSQDQSGTLNMATPTEVERVLAAPETVVEGHIACRR